MELERDVVGLMFSLSPGNQWAKLSSDTLWLCSKSAISRLSESLVYEILVPSPIREICSMRRDSESLSGLSNCAVGVTGSGLIFAPPLFCFCALPVRACVRLKSWRWLVERWVAIEIARILAIALAVGRCTVVVLGLTLNAFVSGLMALAVRAQARMQQAARRAERSVLSV